MIRALVVDDEAPARAKVRRLLAAEDGFEVAGEAADGEQAVELIRRLGPDVVFLDVQMPGLDGFGVVERIGAAAMPPTVFVTAHDRHAVHAFEVEALDYLLKPFAPSRFRRVAERVRRRLEIAAADGAENAAGPADLAGRLERLLTELRPVPAPLTRLLVQRAEGREMLLPVERIDRIRAERNYVRFYTADGEFVRRGTLGDLAERLDAERFLRINRSEIVRLDAVAELQPWFHGDCRVRMADGAVLTWSRRYRARDKERF